MAGAPQSAVATPRTRAGTPAGAVHSPFGIRPRVQSRTGDASPRVDRPDLQVPEAKRPLDAASITIANQGVRVMTLEDLSSAFFSLNSRLERAKGHGGSLFESVDFNAVLLTETCKELIALKKIQAATEQQVAALLLRSSDALQMNLDAAVARMSQVATADRLGQRPRQG